MASVMSADRNERIRALQFDYDAQPREPVADCNLCGAHRFIILTHRDRYGFAAEAHACDACGLVFLNPRLTAEAYGRFYESTYRPLVSAYHGRLIDARTVQDEQRVYASQCIDFLRPFVTRGATTLLDIGGSTGVVASAVGREFGLTATVVDPAPLEIAEARRLGLETVTGLVEKHDFGPRTFDLVMLCQTVDHLLDIRGTLGRVRQLIARDGVLFVDIVDFRAAYLRCRSVEEAIKIDHPYYLTELTMELYLRRAGFEVLRCDYAADHLHVGFACRPASPHTDAPPDSRTVADLLREVRLIQSSA
jgi:hypothetical protein